MSGYFNDAGSFLVEMVFSLYMLAVLLRFLLQLIRADFDPLTRAVVTVTEPPLRYLRRVVPGLRGVDLSPIVLLLIVAVVKVFLLFVMHGVAPKPGAVLVLALADCLKFAVYVVIAAVFVRAIMSWFNPPGYNPVLRLLNDITEPFLTPVRKVLPAMGGLDLSPIIMFIVLTLVLKLVVQPIADYGLLLLR